MTSSGDAADSSPEAESHASPPGECSYLPDDISQALEALPDPQRRKIIQWLEHTEYSGDSFLVLLHSLLDKHPADAEKLINDVLVEREHDRAQEQADAALAREDAKAHARYTRRLNWFITIMTWTVAVGSLTGAGLGAAFAPWVPAYFWLGLAGIGVGGPVAARILARNTSTNVTLGQPPRTYERE